MTILSMVNKNNLVYFGHFGQQYRRTVLDYRPKYTHGFRLSIHNIINLILLVKASIS